MTTTFNDMLADLIDDTPEAEQYKQQYKTVTIKDGVSFQKPVRTDAEEDRIRRLHAAGIIKAPSRKGAKNKRVNVRITEKDSQILEFLSVARLITPKQAKMIAKDSTGEQAAYKRLARLSKAGYLQLIQPWKRGKTFFILGKKGLKWLETNNYRTLGVKLLTERDVLNINLNHTCSMSQFLAMWTAGMTGRGVPEAFRTTQNVMHENSLKALLALNPDAREFKARHQCGPQPIVERHIAKGVAGGSWEDYPGMLLTTTGKQNDGVFYPDFILNFEALRVNAKPMSLAVEIELSRKGSAELDKKLTAYERNGNLKSVCYYYASKEVLRALEKSIARVGAQKVILLPLLDDNGQPFEGDCWRL